MLADVEETEPDELPQAEEPSEEADTAATEEAETLIEERSDDEVRDEINGQERLFTDE